MWIKCAKGKGSGLKVFRFWTHNKQWEELPASNYGFLKLPCGQSDKPADRAGRWIDGRKVRSADIYTSMVRETWEQAHINRKRWVEGMTCKVDFIKQNLIFSSGKTSVKGSWWKPSGSERHACWHGEHLCTHTENRKKSFSVKGDFSPFWFYLYILFYCFNKHKHLTSLCVKTELDGHEIIIRDSFNTFAFIIFCTS